MLTLEQIQKKISSSLESLPIYREPSGLYEPIAYALRQGGKRIRPVLTLVSAQMFGGDPDKALPAATAIEIFHNFTLLHDDIIDQAPLRRGYETVYKKWNVNTAILSGDTMFAVAYGKLAESEPQLLPGLMDIFSKTAIQVCEGQQYDTDYEIAGHVPIEDYIEMITLKTAVLMAASLKIGALIGNAGEKHADAVYQFGLNVGIAFQLQDDLLDAFGDVAVFGKKTGGDITANKKTYLYLKALENSNEQDAAELKRWFSTNGNNPEQKIAAVLRLFEKAGVKEETENLIQYYLQQALTHLDSIEIEGSAKEQLLKVLADLVHRKY